MASAEEPEILGAQRVQKPTYVTIEQVDNRLKQVELRLKKSHEQEKAKRDQLFKNLGEQQKARAWRGAPPEPSYAKLFPLPDSFG